MDKDKTALHAASISGNEKKLRVLLKDLNTRYRHKEKVNIFEDEKEKVKNKNKNTKTI